MLATTSPTSEPDAFDGKSAMLAPRIQRQSTANKARFVARGAAAVSHY